MRQTQDITYSWFPARVSGKSGSGASARYSWVRRWVEGSGSVGNMPNVAGGNATTGDLAGVCLTGEDLAVGDDVLARPGPGAGGVLYELVPVGGSGNSGSGNGGCLTTGSMGWGWVAGLETANHCFEATITAGNASGRSACIGNQTIRLSWDNGSSAWRSGTGANMSFCCGNAPLQLRIANGQPVLSLVGNGNACNNTTLSNYTFSFAGAGASSCVTGDADTLWFSGGGRTLANSALMTQIPGSLPPKPTAYLNTFTVKLELINCPVVTCCSNVTMPTTLHVQINDQFRNTWPCCTAGNSSNFTGNYSLNYYPELRYPSSSSIYITKVWIATATVPFGNPPTTPVTGFFRISCSLSSFALNFYSTGLTIAEMDADLANGVQPAYATGWNVYSLGSWPADTCSPFYANQPLSLSSGSGSCGGDGGVSRVWVTE